MNELLRDIFEPLTDPLGVGLQTFHDWGAPSWLAIFALTVIVRTILFPLTAKQVKNMRRLQELKPELDELRARHKDDPKKQQEALTKLYGERGVNPLGGCLPVLIQLPIFLALYYTIKDFEALGSGGLLWFRDLTIPDPYYVLPIIYVLTMMAAQELTIRYTAPQQQRLMRLLPLVLGLFLALSGFPAGLFVYWISSNLITLCQNYLIYHHNREDAPGQPPGMLRDRETLSSRWYPLPADVEHKRVCTFVVPFNAHR